MRSIGMAAAAIAVLTQPAFADAKRSKARPARIVHPEQWLGADHYPPAALRAGEQGRVIADVEIDASGRPVGCRVGNPGPLPDLESGTCRAVMSRGQFMAALDREGRAVAGVFTLPVRWQLPVMPLSGPVVAPPVLEDVATIFSYARDNRLTSCGMKLNGDSITLPSAECVGLMTFDVATLRQKLALTGPFRIGLSASNRQAASPPPLPGALLEGRDVAFI